MLISNLKKLNNGLDFLKNSYNKGDEMPENLKFGAMNIPMNPILDEIEAIASLGADYLELTMDAPMAHFSTLSPMKNKIKNALADHGLEVVCHLPTFVYTADLTESIRRASVEEMIQSISAAAELGAKKAVIHPGMITGLGQFVPDIAKRLALESFRQIAEKAESIGLLLCVENMPPASGMFFTPDALAEILDFYPEMQMTLDTGHANIGKTKDRDSIAFIERFPDRIGHVHVSDNRGKSDDHIPVGAGNAPMKEIVNALKKIGYNETITLEIFAVDRGLLVYSRDRVKALFSEN